MEKLKNKNAFTLIELLVVVLIIGILASVAVAQYGNIVAKMRMQKALSLMNTLNQAMERYISIHGSHPSPDFAVNNNSDTSKSLQFLDLAFEKSAGFTFTEKYTPGSKYYYVEVEFSQGRVGDYLAWVGARQISGDRFRREAAAMAYLSKYDPTKDYDHSIAFIHDARGSSVFLSSGSCDPATWATKNYCKAVEDIARVHAPWHINQFTSF